MAKQYHTLENSFPYVHVSRFSPLYSPANGLPPILDRVPEMVLMHSAHQPNPKDSVWCQFEPDRTKFEPASSIFEFLLFFYCFWTCNMFVSAVSPFFNRFCPFFDTKSFSVGCLSLWVNWVISEIQKNLYATHKYLYTPGFVLNKYTNT